MPDAIGAAYVEMPDFDGPADFLAKLASVDRSATTGTSPDRGRRESCPAPPSSRTPPVPIIHAIILGLVQGLSEFLPISSSGHLLLVPWLFNWHDFDNTAIEKAFDVALHIGTLVAVVGYFRRDLVVYIREGLRVGDASRPAGDSRRPAGLVAGAVDASGGRGRRAVRKNHRRPARQAGIIAVSLIVFGVMLGLAIVVPGARRSTTTSAATPSRSVRPRCLPLNPGTSRSGITITAARYLRLHPRCRGAGQLPDGDPRHRRRRRLQDAEAGQGRRAAGLAVPMMVGIVTPASPAGRRCGERCA